MLSCLNGLNDQFSFAVVRESVVLEDVALEESHEVVDVYLTGLQKK